MNSPRHSNLGRDGFTLLEVLVASVVLSIVLTILLGTLSTSMSLWRNTENKLASDREGRSAELLLADDLSGVVMPANPALWPRVVDKHLQFLSLKPVDYQATNAGNVGDVCFVEYFVDAEKGDLNRVFLGSKETFDEILKTGQFPSPTSEADEENVLADNLLENTSDAVRGLVLEANANPENFVVLNTNMVLLTGSYSAANRPAAIEVTLAVADPTSMEEKNKAIWQQNSAVRLRNAGIYSFRVSLPAPPAP